MNTTRYHLLTFLGSLFIVFAVVAAMGAVYGQQVDEHSLKQDKPALGSIVKKRLVTTVISMDKPYQDLSIEEQRLIRSDYDNLPEQDEPPYPLRGTRELMRKISTAQQLLLVKGVLKMTVDVSSTGEAESVSVYESPNSDLTKVTALALMEEKYKPGVCHGEPCKMPFLVVIHFKVAL